MPIQPPRRQLSTSRRHPSQIQEIFIGLGIKLNDKPPPDSQNVRSTGNASDPGTRDMEYSIVLHDGTGVVDSETYHHPFAGRLEEADTLSEAAMRLSKEILQRLDEVQREKGMDIRVVAAARPIPEELRVVKGVEWMASVWLHLDAIPFVITPATTMFDRLPAPSTQASGTSAISSALSYLHPATHSATIAATDPHTHSVLVDCDQSVQLTSLLQYKQGSTPELWSRFESLYKHLRQHRTTIAFFSATPQGGGVALMRHALIRLWRLVGMDVKWYVPEGHPVVFDITKRKIHNVLQGVARENVEMSQEDKEWFESWTEQNYEAFWKDGAIDADLIVIDDPQLTALIPIIKKRRPNAKIIFRSHIQIQSDLTDDPSTSQYRTWNYLFNFIKDVDLFLAHPVKQFVPKNVLAKLPVLYMAPSTDPLDGLNKPYGAASIAYYRQYFNSLARQQGGNTIDWDRGYICQIARFDPSKGIDVLLEAYLQFRQRIASSDVSDDSNDGKGPQLIIMGHGSVDDPDGTLILEQCFDTLSSDEYTLVKDDVALLRAPPSDSVLGCILQGAWVATQLSTREGFEVKVTEAIHKRVPIIASDAGGIPLQVKHGINGWIVPCGGSKVVSSLLYDLYTGKTTLPHYDLARLAPRRHLHSDLNANENEIPSILGSSNASDTPSTPDTPNTPSDPNISAQTFVKDPTAPVRLIHDPTHPGSTSEDFWTVGNAVKWMLLASRVLGLGLDLEGDLEVKSDAQRESVHGANEEKRQRESQVEQRGMGLERLDLDNVEVLKRMGVGEGKRMWGVNDPKGGNVWKLVMGDDLCEGEGGVRGHQ